LARKLFCEYGPLAFKLSVQKEKAKRFFSNLRKHVSFAKTKSEALLPHVAATYSSYVATEIEGVPAATVRNRANNIYLAAEKTDGIVVYPGETFSFWNIVGKNGYDKALIISNGKLIEEYGGGLCLLATLIHNMVLNTPLSVVELHHHSDALFPDKADRVPYQLGVSAMYNYIDYRFKNTTGQKIQIKLYKTPASLTGELRSEIPFPNRYRLLEEDHHFVKSADGCFYRNSKIYRLILDSQSGEVLKKELKWDNHSKVMYDPNLIPENMLRNAAEPF